MIIRCKHTEEPRHRHDCRCYLWRTRPLLDQTDGSHSADEQSVGQLANSAITSAVYRMKSKSQLLSEMRVALEMDVAEFNEFQRSIVSP